jgi:hypothetical protein
MKENIRSILFSLGFYLLIFGTCFLLAHATHQREDAIRDPLLQRIQQLELELERCHCEP